MGQRRAQQEPSGDNPLWQEVAELLGRGGRVSRNRNFSRFAGPRGRAALRLYRILRTLGKDLEAAANNRQMSVRATQDDGGLWLEVSDPERSYHRRCHVPAVLAPLFLERLEKLGVSVQAQPTP